MILLVNENRTLKFQKKNFKICAWKEKTPVYDFVSEIYRKWFIFEIFWYYFSEYLLLIKELKFWNFPNIKKFGLEALIYIGKKRFNLKKKKKFFWKTRLLFLYKINEYPNENYHNSIINEITW